ncbi:hypothetical protein [Liquorilactobacillus satsumensis]|uniref:hypothetical protein n=1 Tax=Liquorilactobacillus satsumensis TaxID=259059 RepID=UPI001E4355AE|nr:hypothetical protein [Liquorilactobacillus satsumensis]
MGSVTEKPELAVDAENSAVFATLVAASDSLVTVFFSLVEVAPETALCSLVAVASDSLVLIAVDATLEDEVLTEELAAAALFNASLLTVESVVIAVSEVLARMVLLVTLLSVVVELVVDVFSEKLVAALLFTASLCVFELIFDVFFEVLVGISLLVELLIVVSELVVTAFPEVRIEFCSLDVGAVELVVLFVPLVLAAFSLLELSEVAALKLVELDTLVLVEADSLVLVDAEVLVEKLSLVDKLSLFSFVADSDLVEVLSCVAVAESVFVLLLNVADSLFAKTLFAETLFSTAFAAT